MYNALGINWASCLAGFIGLLFTPVPFLLLIYGRRIRRMTKHGRHSEDHSMALAAERRECCDGPGARDPKKIECSHNDEQDCVLDRVMSVP
jgi:DHA1 family multidrug resistance protein-like MFS transporter